MKENLIQNFLNLFEFNLLINKSMLKVVLLNKCHNKYHPIVFSLFPLDNLANLTFTT